MFQSHIVEGLPVFVTSQILKRTRNGENNKTMEASGQWIDSLYLNLFLKDSEYYKQIEILTLELKII